jgi:subtilisin family serine protease
MNIQLLFTVSIACILCSPTHQLAPLTLEDSTSRIPGEYVVVLKDGIGDDEVSAHMSTVRDLFADHGNNNTHNVLMHEYKFEGFCGYGAKMDDKLRDMIRSLEHIDYVECAQVYTTQTCKTQFGAAWGLVRTTSVQRPLDEAYTYEDNAGAGVDVYVIDTGIEITHPLFNGRALWGADFAENPSPRTDLNGHGTHVAGTVVAELYGITRSATAIAVRVLDRNGQGSTNAVMAGINYVANKHSSGKKSIANMSLGGGYSRAMNIAVNSATNKGVTFVVAAGNEGTNACNNSPGSAYYAYTVGASDERDRFASFSNYGYCVSIIAPGVDITSLWLNGGINTISGTSMACPHVAGVMAKYLSNMPSSTTPDQLMYHVHNL